MKKVIKYKTKYLPFSDGNHVAKFKYIVHLDNSVVIFVSYNKTVVEKDIGIINEDLVENYEPDEELLFEMMYECMEVKEGLWD